MQSKEQLRSVILKQRRNLPSSQRRQAARNISAQIAKISAFKRSKHVAFYMPVNGEVDTLFLLQQALFMGKHCYLPVLHPIKQNFLWFIEYKTKDPLTKNRYGIFEPKINLRKKIPARNLNLVFTPLVAFDAAGNRLGSGKGYYDRTFAFLKKGKKFKTQLIGLAYEMQKTGKIHAESWDIPLQMAVTELNIYNFAAK